MGAPRKIAGRRVVLDTDVVLSALLFSQGSLAWLREAWQGRQLVPLASREAIAELLRALAYPKFKLSADDQEELLAEYLPWCETVTISRSIRLPHCRGPHDEAFLRLARLGRAHVLVSADAELISLAKRFPVPMVRPAELQAVLPR